MTNNNDNSDIYPTFVVLNEIKPSINGYSDMYTAGEVASGGQLMGILGLTYPAALVLE